jgi:hypothetical protein
MRLKVFGGVFGVLMLAAMAAPVAGGGGVAEARGCKAFADFLQSLPDMGAAASQAAHNENVPVPPPFLPDPNGPGGGARRVRCRQVRSLHVLQRRIGPRLAPSFAQTREPPAPPRPGGFCVR